MEAKESGSIKPYLYAGLALRLGLIMYGDYQDQTMEVKFTDVDYRVFTDASRHVLNGESPYERHTYRYTPILAWMLAPNLLLTPLYGKILFGMFDIMTSYLIYQYLWNDGYSRQTALKCSWIWLFNPLVMAVSSRGNADSLVVMLVIAALFLYKERVFFLAGMFLGLAIHFKLYPIIFSLPMFLALTEKKGVSGLFVINVARFRLVTGTVLTLAILTGIGYYLYGMEFIQEAYLHHLSRRDTRHNFSVYFYMLYLTVEDDDVGLNLISFLPQVILLLALSKKFSYFSDIPMCVFCQTFVFVAYNKVCTSQYFLWYLAPLAIVLPKLKISKREGFFLIVIWGSTQASWLLPAYLLEFSGSNTFLYIWFESLAFFCANVYIMSKFVRKYIENGNQLHALKQE